MAACTAILFLGGCAQGNQPPLAIDQWREVAAPAGSTAAADAVAAVYGMPGLPEIHWYGGAGLDCPGNPSAWYSAQAKADVPSSNGCIYGRYSGGVAAVAVRDYWESTLAHEILHNFYDIFVGNEDGKHAFPGWKDGTLQSAAMAAALVGEAPSAEKTAAMMAAVTADAPR